MGKPSIDPKKVSWNSNIAKREADLTIYRAMSYDMLRQMKGGKQIRALTLPAKTWAWERGLVECYDNADIDFTGLERDPEIHKATKRAGRGLPATFKMHSKPMDFISFAKSNAWKDPFDIVYLDWMGTWSEEKKDDIATLYSREMLNAGGLLLLTVSLCRGHPKTLCELEDLSYNLPFAFYDARGSSKFVSNIKVRGIPHWIQNHAKVNYGVSMRLIMASVYYSSAGLRCQNKPQLQLLMLRES